MDPSGLRFYVASRLGMLATITRDITPKCASIGARAPFNTAISIPLTCSDANGDPFVVEKGTLPAKGQLGAIENNGAVFYSPFANFIGPDSFTYRAVTPSRGVAGPFATIEIGVDGPPAPGPPPTPQGSGVDRDRDGFFAGQDCNDDDAAIRPGRDRDPRQPDRRELRQHGRGVPDAVIRRCHEVERSAVPSLHLADAAGHAAVPAGLEGADQVPRQAEVPVHDARR